MTPEKELELDVWYWQQKHKECGPDCVITGDECSDDPVTKHQYSESE